MTRVQQWRRRLVVIAVVLGVLGIAIGVGVSPSLQSFPVPWWVGPGVVVGPVLVILGIDAVVLRAFLPRIASQPTTRARFLVVLILSALALGALAVGVLFVVEVIESLLVYCIPRGFDGCGP